MVIRAIVENNTQVFAHKSEKRAHPHCLLHPHDPGRSVRFLRGCRRARTSPDVALTSVLEQRITCNRQTVSVIEVYTLHRKLITRRKYCNQRFGNYSTGFSGGSRIFLGGAPTPKVGVLTNSFAENCMKMREFGVRGARPWPPPIRQWSLLEAEESEWFGLTEVLIYM